MPDLSGVVQPGVDRVAGGAQVGLSKLVLLGPAQWGVAETLLDYGVEPGQQEVEPGTLVGSLGGGRRRRRVTTGNQEEREQKKCWDVA